MSLSILIPTYKRPALLRRNLASIIESMVKVDEVVVGDDGGDEETRMVCGQFASRLPLRYLRPEGKGSLATNVTRLLKASRMEWILLLHDDDYLTGNHSDFPAQFEYKCDLFFTDHWICEESGEINLEKTTGNSIAYGRSALKEGIQYDNLGIALHQKICLDGFYVRRSKIDGIFPDPKFGHVADFIWVFDLLNSSLKVWYANRRTFAYRLSPDGLTGSGGRINEDTVLGLNAIRERLMNKDLISLVASKISMNTWYAVNAALRRGAPHTAFSLLKDLNFNYTHSSKHKILIVVQLLWILLKKSMPGKLKT
ncbi:glycosyltransferase family 2 protein [Pedobacter sp. SAFR-022]|uniref:glycosyltransferase family 2 protein n=1 Tax=Pedobacter sp. SAFR-022 TaxID=3436861 RepID=UPI003F814805